MVLKVGITHSLRILAGLLFSLAPLPSLAITVSQPYPIFPHTTASSSQVQADFSALYSTINGYLDASNFSSSTGIYASQIIPTSSGQATFGGSQNYTFPQSVTAMNNLVFGNNTTGGTLNGSTGSETISGSYIGTGLSIIGNASISGTTSLNGAVSAPGGISTSTLGAGTSITNNGPLNNGGTINANNTATSILAAGNIISLGSTTADGSISTKTDGVYSQVIPAIIDGVQVVSRVNAHIEAFAITASGTTFSGTYHIFDSISGQLPRCTISSLTPGGGSPSIQPLNVSAFQASNLVGGQSYTVICVGA